MLNLSFRNCFIVSAMAALVAVTSASAQEPVTTAPAPGASPGTATAGRVIVTGSNIPTAEEVGPNPVDTYNRDTMNKSGERTTEQFLQSLPTVNANVVPISNNENGSNTAGGQRRFRCAASTRGRTSSLSMD